MYNIGIIGIGLMGGSLAKGFAKSPKVNKIVGYDLIEYDLIQAKKDGVITEYTLEIDESFSDLDVVFICTPVSYIFGYIEQLKQVIKEGCIITDIGSTKSTIMKKVENLDINFIGGHPMVGSEKSGYSASKTYLYENAYYIITKSQNSIQENIEVIKELVTELNAIPIEVEWDKHDYIVAAISHVPHIVASTLVNMVKGLDGKEKLMKKLAAGGFKDTTRIASSSPVMWQNICKENREQILKVLKSFQNILSDFEKNIENSDEVYDFFCSSKSYRDTFNRLPATTDETHDINIDIEDVPGGIAKVTTIISEIGVNIKNIGIINNREHTIGVLQIMFYSNIDKEKSIEILTKKGYNIF